MLTKRKPLFPALAFLSLLVIFANSIFAQDLGEVARRQRRQNRQKPPAHVYTNEDMKRSEILLPEDRARIEASRKLAPAENATEHAAAPAPKTPNAKPSALPLGDVARYYRELHRLQNAQRKSRENVLPVAPALAMPKLAMPTLMAPRGPRDPFSQAPQHSPVPFGAAAPRKSELPHRALQPRTPKQLPHEMSMQTSSTVTVRRGDSLWKLAARYLGDGTKWHAILAVNPQLSDPNRILVGERLALPHEVQASAETPTQSAGTLRVQSGDSMWKLAQNHLGSGPAWNCIAQANPQIQDANVIYPGEVLNIPAACSQQGGDVQSSRVLPITPPSN